MFGNIENDKNKKNAFIYIYIYIEEYILSTPPIVSIDHLPSWGTCSWSCAVF